MPAIIVQTELKAVWVTEVLVLASPPEAISKLPGDISEYAVVLFLELYVFQTQLR